MGQEEADGELQVEGGAGVLDGSAQEEGEGRQEEAEQRQAQPHVGDHGQHWILLDVAGEKRLQLAFVLDVVVPNRPISQLWFPIRTLNGWC